jgi:hypothetical protein
MERNPYAPPVSAVADPAESRSERPKEVTLAVKLLWASFFIGIAGVFLRPAQQVPFIAVLIVSIMAFGFWAWVITSIAKGRNWARILFFVLVGIGVVFALLFLSTTLALYRERPFNGFLAAINYALEIYTLYLLLRAPAREWFNQQPAQ